MLQLSATCRVSSRHFARQGYAKTSHHFHSTRSRNAVEQQQPQPASITCHTRDNGRIATITIHNAAKMNIVNSALLSQLTETCHSLHSHNALRAVILTSAPPLSPNKPPSFIGGADIREMHALQDSSAARTFITHVHAACAAIRAVPVPVIARVHGFTLGAGVELLASCDVRVATTQSAFGMPEVRVGIPSVVEAALLPQLIGFGRTRRLLYFGELISAVEAERWGLVEKVVEDERELEKCVDEWAGVLCEATTGPRAVRSQKRLIRKWETCTVDEGIQAGIEAFAEAFADGAEEPREHMKRFINRNRK